MFKQCIDIYEHLDSPRVTGESLRIFFLEQGASDVWVQTIEGESGKTDFLRILVPGTNGRTANGPAHTLGITGRLGGIGARPKVVGFVSDGDGALAALAVALKLCRMAARGDRLEGDVVISTHICPEAPIVPHDPVPLMDSPVDTITLNRLEMEVPVDAVLSIDTTKGNRLLNHNGIAITCTVKEGYILRVSEDLLDIYSQVTGTMPWVLPLSQQDITPYGNGVYHLNSIVQPAVATTAPVVGVAITTESPVAGCASGATHLVDVELAARFSLEVAKAFTRGACQFFDKKEYARLVELYGTLHQFMQPVEEND